MSRCTCAATFLAPPQPAVRAGVLVPSALAVDPAALASAPAALDRRAAPLRLGTPAVLAAWDQAAATLAGEHAGAVLAASRPGGAAALEACARAVEALASSLRWSSSVYANAESAAWMP